MSRTDEAGNFFQTESYLKNIRRRSEKSIGSSGDPIKLTSKVLAVISDSRSRNYVYTAESAGTAKRISLDTRKVVSVYRGASAPLSSLALNSTGTILYGGCWDRSIWSWNTETRTAGQRFYGHSDFVKCLAFTQLSKDDNVAKLLDILISGGSDGKIILWHASTGQKLHVLNGHTRAVLDLIVVRSNSTSIDIFSCGSSPEIKQWKFSLDHAKQLELRIGSTIFAHQTSVNRIKYYSSVNTETDGEEFIWTASSDFNTLCLSREQNWAAVVTLKHPDFVKDVLFIEQYGWVVTACRDENVRVWEAESGILLCILNGHFEEVIGLTLGFVDGKECLVSASIDNTVRTWHIESEIAALNKTAMSPTRDEECQNDVRKTSCLTLIEEEELEALMNEN